jgi:hypothetical protein
MATTSNSDNADLAVTSENQSDNTKPSGFLGTTDTYEFNEGVTTTCYFVPIVAVPSVKSRQVRVR